MLAVCLKILFSAGLFMNLAEAAPELEIRYVWRLESPTSDVSNILIEYAPSGLPGARNFFALGYERRGVIERVGRIYPARRARAILRNEASTGPLASSPRSDSEDDMTLDFDRRHLFSGEEIGIFGNANRYGEHTALLKRSRENGIETETLSGLFGDTRVDSKLVEVKRRLDPGMGKALVLRFAQAGRALSFRRDGSHAGDVIVVITGRKLNSASGAESLSEAKVVIGWLTPEGIVPSDAYAGLQEGTVVYLTRDHAPILENPMMKIDTFREKRSLWIANGNVTEALVPVHRAPEDPARPSIHAYARAFEAALHRETRIERPELSPHPVHVGIIGVAESDCAGVLSGRQMPPAPAAVLGSMPAALDGN